MKYIQPFDQPGNPDASYVNGNPATGTPGSIADARAWEHPQREIVNAIKVTGQAPQEGTMMQLAQAVCTGVHLAVAGTANALTSDLPNNVEFPALIAGMTFTFIVNANNTGPVTINFGYGAKQIVHKDGTVLKADELRAGQVARITYDGVKFQFDVSYGRLLNTQVFKASGTYTPTPGTAFIRARVLGGGGGGGGCTLPASGSVSMGGPGTAGTYAEGTFTASQIGASQAVTVGVGGVGQVGGGGLNGNASSIGALITAPGGLGGTMLNNQVAPTVNGTGSISPAASGDNLFSVRGAAGSVSMAVSQFVGYGAMGGNSQYGTGGYSQSVNANGASASGYGAGGAASFINNAAGVNTKGGDGTAGIVIIEEYSL